MSDVTSITDLQEYAKGQLVDLPPFAENQPFTARMRRPSLLILSKSGKIPNTLMNTANELFNGKQDPDDPPDLADVLGVMDVICESSLVEPTLQQIKEVGLELTDEQYMAIFAYSQRGLKALDNFRQEQIQPEQSSGDVAEVQKTSI